MKTHAFLKIDLKQKPNRREKIIFSVALGLLFIVFVSQCAWPSMEAIGVSKNNLQELVKQRQELEASLKPIPEVAGEPTKKWIADSKQDLESAIEEVTESIYLRGVEITKLQFSELAKQQSFTTRIVTISLNGQFEVVGRYIEHLENMNAPLVIQSIAIEPSTENPGDILVNLSGNIYAAD